MEKNQCIMVGKIPLSEMFIFGSELKAVKSFPELNLAIDRGSLSLFLSHAYVPCPHSIYEDIFSLEPGEILEVSIDDKTSKRKKYWDVSEVIKNNTVNKFNGTPDDAVKKLESLIASSVKRQNDIRCPSRSFFVRRYRALQQLFHSCNPNHPNLSRLLQ